VQWIREQQQSVATEAIGGQHRRRTAAHRATTDDPRFRAELLGGTRYDSRETLLEPRHRVWTSGFLFLVEEVEAYDADSAPAKIRGGLHQSAVVHVSARAVCT